MESRAITKMPYKEKKFLVVMLALCLDPSLPLTTETIIEAITWSISRGQIVKG